MKINLAFFPFPYIVDGQKFDGTILIWPEVCYECQQKICQNAKIGSLSLCSYGYNYLRIDQSLTIGGFIVREWGQLSQARKKTMRQYPELIVPKIYLDRTFSSLQKGIKDFEDEVEETKKRLIQQYIDKEQYRLDFLNALKPTITEGLSFVHDYKQINAEISQNINVIIETKYEGATIEEKIDKSSEQEKSIYMASKLLEEKMNVVKLLLNPFLMNDSSKLAKFRFHGIVIKYRRIYTSHIKNKSIDLQFIGQSYQEIVAHPDAVSVIPHTFIDNAIKYSPKGGRIEIGFQDFEGYIKFFVSSFGPKILREERTKIFEAFERGQYAKKQEEEGAGYGLYISQLVAKKHLGSEIIVEQDPQITVPYGYWTTFSIDIPLKAAIIS